MEAHDLAGHAYPPPVNNHHSARQANLGTKGDGYTHPLGKEDEDEDDLPSLYELFRIPKLARACSGNHDPTERAHHRAPEEHSAPISPNGNSRTWRSPQRGRDVRASSPAAAIADLVPQEIIDLTADGNVCAVCSHGVHEGNGNAARVFLFEVCGCVTCGECLIRHETPIPITKLRCHRNDHVSSGCQKVRELFGTDSQNCLICLDKLVDRTSTPCGHSFCRSCFAEYARFMNGHQCPACRAPLPGGSAHLLSFQAVGYRIVSQILPVPASTPTGNCHGNPGCDAAQPKGTPRTHPSTAFDGDLSVAESPSSQRRVGFAGRGMPRFSAMPYGVAGLVGHSEAMNKSSATSSGTNTSRHQRGCSDALPANGRKDHGAGTGANAPRPKKRRHNADNTDYFPSYREEKRRVHEERSVETSGKESCLRVQSICLLIDKTSCGYECSRHKKQWDCKDHLEMEYVVPDIMNDFFARPGADFLRALVRVDDQLLDFEWILEDRRWAAMDIERSWVYLETQMMCEIISEPMKSLWAVVP